MFIRGVTLPTYRVTALPARIHEAALVATWANDRAALQVAGLRVETVRELPAFVEVRVSDPTETVLVQWARDSAFRFFEGRIRGAFPELRISAAPQR